jgi:hypothetical protein
MNKLEKEIEAKLVKMIKSHGGLCLKWVCPGWSGVPDRICLLPGGRIYFVELKRPKGGRISPQQRWWDQKLQALGFFVAYINTEAGIKILEQVIQGEVKT